jgi:hypothetical protein
VPRTPVALALWTNCRLRHVTLALQCIWKNCGAEAAENPLRLLAEFSLENRTVWTRKPCRPRAEAAGHGVLSGTAHEPLAVFLRRRMAVPGERSERRASRAEALRQELASVPLHGKNAARSSSPRAG